MGKHTISTGPCSMANCPRLPEGNINICMSIYIYSYIYIHVVPGNLSIPLSIFGVSVWCLLEVGLVLVDAR